MIEIAVAPPQRALFIMAAARKTGAGCASQSHQPRHFFFSYPLLLYRKKIYTLIFSQLLYSEKVMDGRMSVFVVTVVVIVRTGGSGVVCTEAGLGTPAITLTGHYSSTTRNKNYA